VILVPRPFSSARKALFQGIPEKQLFNLSLTVRSDTLNFVKHPTPKA